MKIKSFKNQPNRICLMSIKETVKNNNSISSKVLRIHLSCVDAETAPNQLEAIQT